MLKKIINRQLNQIESCFKGSFVTYSVYIFCNKYFTVSIRKEVVTLKTFKFYSCDFNVTENKLI